MSKHQSRGGDGRGVSGLLPPSRWHLGKNRVGRRETERGKYSVWEKRRVEGRKSDARKKGRRRRKFRRAAQKIRTGARARSRAGELVVGTYDVRARALKGTNCIGHAEVMLNICEDAGCDICDIIGLQEVSRNGQSAFAAAGYVVFCSGADGGEHEKKGNHEVGLAVRKSIVAEMDKGHVAAECISARLMKVLIQLKGKSNGVSFIVRYAPTLDKSENDYFWNPLDEVVKGVPSRDHLLVLMDANARTGMRGIGWTDSKVLGAYGRDELNDNGKRLLTHATDNKLALLNTYYSTPARGISYTFKSPDRGKAQYRLDYILTRQVDRRLVRNVTVRTPPRENALGSNHNLVIGNTRLLGRIAPNLVQRESSKTGELLIYQD